MRAYVRLCLCKGKQQCKRDSQGEWLLREWLKGIQSSMHTDYWHTSLIEYNWTRSRPAMVAYTHANAQCLYSLPSLHTPPLLSCPPRFKVVRPSSCRCLSRHPPFHILFPSSPSLPFSFSLPSLVLSLLLLFCAPTPPRNPTFVAHAHILPLSLVQCIESLRSQLLFVCLFICLLLRVVGYIGQCLR